jgi:hypothetical protein
MIPSHLYGMIPFPFYDFEDMWDKEILSLADWWILFANRVQKSICIYIVQ